MGGHGLQAELGVDLPLGAPEMRGENHAGTLGLGVLNGRQGGLNPGVVCHLEVVGQWHIEIHANKQPFSLDGEIS